MHIQRIILFLIIMSDTIDLTTEEDDDNNPSTEEVDGTGIQNSSNKKRKKRDHRPPPPPPPRPSRVFVVIHDKEPPDTGDSRYSEFLPSRQDTEIVGIFYDYKKAAKNATNL